MPAIPICSDARENDGKGRVQRQTYIFRTWYGHERSTSLHKVFRGGGETFISHARDWARGWATRMNGLANRHEAPSRDDHAQTSKCHGDVTPAKGLVAGHSRSSRSSRCRFRRPERRLSSGDPRGNPKNTTRHKLPMTGFRPEHLWSPGSFRYPEGPYRGRGNIHVFPGRTTAVPYGKTGKYDTRTPGVTGFSLRENRGWLETALRRDPLRRTRSRYRLNVFR